MNMKRILALALALVLVFALAACGKKPDAAPQGGDGGNAGGDPTVNTGNDTGNDAGGSVAGKTVAFIPKVSGNAFFEVANEGAQKYAQQWGMNVEYIGEPEASVAAQVRCINDAIAKGVDAISISTVDAAGVSDALKEAADAGIVVSTWDSDSISTDRTLMVSQGTPEVLGRMLVNMAVAGLEARGVDPNGAVKYAWHYSQATVTDQNSWQVAGEEIIAKEYPNWINVQPSNYYSEQNAEKSVSVGTAVLDANPDIDLIICNDSTALPGQLEAAQKKGLTKQDVTITGFATPNAIKPYCEAGVLHNWGLWDCGIQGAMGCYVAAYIAAGNTVKVGDKIDIPGIGSCEVLGNDCLEAGASTGATNNGVVLLPEDVIFTAENMNDYNF